MEKENKKRIRKPNILFNNKNRISISLLLSYLVILIVPFLALMIIYYTASDLLLQVQIGKVSNSLANTATNLDRQLEETYNVGRYISKDTQLLSLCRMDSEKIKKASYYDMYEMTTNFPNYNLTNQIIQDVYMFFREQDYVVKQPTLVPAKENAYQTLDFVGGLTYEECINRYTNEYYEGNILHTTSGVTGEDYFLMLQSFPYGTVGKPYGVTIFVLNKNMILEQLNSVLESSEGMTLICDKNGDIIQAVGGEDGFINRESIPLKQITKAEGSVITIDGKNYIACVQQSEVATWTMVSLISTSELMKRIGWMRYAIILLSVTSIGIALCICILKWKRNTIVINRYCDFRTALNPKEKDCNSFWQSLPLFLDSVEGLQAEMKEQKNILKAEVLRKILYNEYRSREELQYDLKLLELDMKAEHYNVVVIKKDDNYYPADGNFDELRSTIKDYLKEQSETRYMIYEMNYLSMAIVLMNDQQRETEKFREMFYQLIVLLQEKHNRQAYIGIGDEVDGLTQLHQSYFQALKVSEYLKYYNLRIPMTESELPANTNNFYFPVEMEIRFSKALLRGKSEELDKIIQEIRQENIVHRKLNITMLSHLADMIRCTSIRALKEAENDKMDLWIRKLELVLDLEEIFRLVHDAKRMIGEEEKDRQQEINLKLKNEIETYLEENYSHYDLNIGVLSEQLHMPETKLYQEFKNCFGISFSEYLEAMRITKACALLNQHFTIKTVAEMVGYGSDYSFRRAFKRVVGVSPSNYAQVSTTQESGKALHLSEL